MCVRRKQVYLSSCHPPILLWDLSKAWACKPLSQHPNTSAKCQDFRNSSSTHLCYCHIHKDFRNKLKLFIIFFGSFFLWRALLLNGKTQPLLLKYLSWHAFSSTRDTDSRRNTPTVLRPSYNPKHTKAQDTFFSYPVSPSPSNFLERCWCRRKRLWQSTVTIVRLRATLNSV